MAGTDTVRFRGRILRTDDGQEWDDGVVTVRAGRVEAVEPWHGQYAQVTRWEPEAYVAPGLIDIHTHGGSGHDTMDGRPDTLEALARHHWARGVTRFVTSTMTASRPDLLAAVRAVGEAAPRVPSCLGLHLEGPYLNADHRGAQVPDHLRSPDLAELQTLWEVSGGRLRQITLAPELEGGLEAVRWCRENGVIPALGHSGAPYSIAQAAIAQGLRHATHLFNGMASIHHRNPGPVPALLASPSVTLELIVDGIHLDPAVVRWVVQQAGQGRIVLVTDSIRAAGLADGDYELGGQTVHVANGIARTDSGSLAGSTLRLLHAVFNFARFSGCALSDALAAATLNAARVLGMEWALGSLTPGKLGDVVVFNANEDVLATYVAGTLVYSRD
jgi:N-acetylglucosamine-6-phosphate deacetylase